MRQQTLADIEPDGEPCPTCGQIFDSKHGVAAHHWQAHDEKLGEKEYSCDNCGSSFTRGRNEDYDNNFCSSECQYEHQQGRNHQNYNSVTLVCETCGSEFERNKSHLNESAFCSRDCYAESLEGTGGPDHPYWSRVEVDCENCGKGVWKKQHQLDGRTHFCGVGCKQEYDKKRSTPATLVTAVRRSLSERSWEWVADKYRSGECEWCGASTDETGRNHDVHHIIPVYAGGTNDSENLMEVCRSCHDCMERYTGEIPEIESVLVE